MKLNEPVYKMLILIACVSPCSLVRAFARIYTYNKDVDDKSDKT